MKKSNRFRIGPPLIQVPLTKNICHHPLFEKWVRQIPFLINNYSFQKIIGCGSYSVVFRVHHRGYDRSFAAKVIPLTPYWSDKPSNVGDIELNALQKLNHKNIIKLYDNFIESNCLVLILELCLKGTIRQLIHNQNNLSTDLIIIIMADLLSSIEYIHSRYIVHRDIKPGNIFLDEFNRPLLADFGLALDFSIEIDKNSQLEIISNEFVGTLMYRAPEIILNKPHNPFKSDIWSLGLTFYFMITGDEPWDTSSAEALKNSIIKCEFSFPNNISQHFIDLITPMLSIKDRKSVV